MNILMRSVNRKLFRYFKGLFTEFIVDAFLFLLILDSLINRIVYFCFSTDTEPLCIRTLFAPDSLGLTKYKLNRDKEHSFTTQLEEFKSEVKQNIKRAVPILTRIDNLKRFLHLINGNSEEIELLRKALHVYLMQREQWHQKSDVDIRDDYIFGPIVMRAFSHLKIPNAALDVSSMNF